MQSFVKICATGNDFLLLDGLNAPITMDLKDIPLWCHRQKGFGADGVVVLKPHSKLAFEWTFFNSDGQEAELCGNAARAVSKYYALSAGKLEFSFLTRVGEIFAKVPSKDRLSESVEVQIPLWKTAEQRDGYYFVNSGVPHAVVEKDSLRDLNALKSEALKVKALPEFSKEGVNVTFRTANLGSEKISSVTFERGVENFTLSCGTGAIAAAVSSEGGKLQFEKTVEVPGGTLTVEANGKNVWLKGEATVIGTCTLGVFE